MHTLYPWPPTSSVNHDVEQQHAWPATWQYDDGTNSDNEEEEDR